MKQINVFLAMLLLLSGLISACGGGSSGTDEVVIISGHIERMDGVPVQGVSVSIVDTLTNNLGNGPAIVETDSNGNFIKKWGTSAFPQEIDKQEILITPSHPDFSFSPTEYTFTLIYQDKLDINFIADPLLLK